jgi:mono/diheme cytochrome c family protein
MSGTARVLLPLCASALLAGCGSARKSEPLTQPVVLSEAAQRGEVLFMRHCNQCHPGGEGGLAPALNDKPFPGFLKRFQVRHGLGAMPSFSKDQLGDREVDDIVFYLAALKNQPPAR